MLDEGATCLVHATTSLRHANVLLCRALLHDQRRRRGRDADERDLLNVRAVGVAGLQTGFLELIDQVRDRLFFAPGARESTLELVRREHFVSGQARGHVEVGKLRRLACRARTAGVVSAGGCCGVELEQPAQKSVNASDRHAGVGGGGACYIS